MLMSAHDVGNVNVQTIRFRPYSARTVEAALFAAALICRRAIRPPTHEVWYVCLASVGALVILDVNVQCMCVALERTRALADATPPPPTPLHGCQAPVLHATQHGAL